MVAQTSGFVALGLALGAAFFAALRLNARLYLGHAGRLPAALLQVARIGVAGGAFLLAARWGAAALLGTFAGFLVARMVALRVAGR